MLCLLRRLLLVLLRSSFLGWLIYHGAGIVEHQFLGKDAASSLGEADRSYVAVHGGQCHLRQISTVWAEKTGWTRAEKREKRKEVETASKSSWRSKESAGDERLGKIVPLVRMIIQVVVVMKASDCSCQKGGSGQQLGLHHGLG